MFIMFLHPRRTETVIATRGFHKLDEIGNNANIGIRGFTT